MRSQIARLSTPEESLTLDHHVASIPVPGEANHYGLAVNAKGTLMALVSFKGHAVFLVSLPSGEMRREVGSGGPGTEPGKFHGPFRCCFAPGDNLLVAESGNKRLQELSADGEYRCFIGLPVNPVSVCCNESQIAVGAINGRLLLYEYASGSFLREVGTGALSKPVDCIRFSLDSRTLFARQQGTHRAVAVCVADGSLIGDICEGAEGNQCDVLMVPSGDLVVADNGNARVSVYSRDGKALKRTFGARGGRDGEFERPVALAYANRRLYVLDTGTKRVQVFE